ncbi:hypothetical protein FRAHR75_280044 [Frankia sp. Hr75.2]|nr:hypothetical protein FRAHR75_280044 [Frankia sp. Hr75.2]SQD94442.1 hypothetical protein FMEAI12_2560013 [Parafrankia sp. Ea1.12]
MQAKATGLVRLRRTGRGSESIASKGGEKGMLQRGAAEEDAMGREIVGPFGAPDRRALG